MVFFEMFRSTNDKGLVPTLINQTIDDGVDDFERVIYALVRFYFYIDYTYWFR